MLTINTQCAENENIPSSLIKSETLETALIEGCVINVFTYVCPDNWEPRLARLEMSGYVNAWMGRNKMSWIQVRHTPYILFVTFTDKTEIELSEM